jgi:gliding motility-associated-like protein
VNYQSTSSPNATQFSWSYTTTQNQTVTATGSPHTFTFTQGSYNPYTNFNSIHNYSFAPSVTLVATSPAGCTASVVNVFHTLTKPAASFYKDKQNGCVPLAVTYSNNSFVFPFNQITSYTWCNGATPNVFVTGTGSNIPAQVYTYTSTGTYTPYLIIQTAGGCMATSFVDTVRVAVPPVISFSASPAAVCWNQPVQIVNTTAPAVISQIKHWYVESDNGFFSGCIGDPNPSWKFNHVGVHGFTMSAYVNGCKGTAQYQNVTVNGPIVSARYETNCTNRYSVDFYANLQAVTNFTLDFGDASPKRIVSGNTSVSDFTSHVYAASGDYVATLSGSNANTGCPLSTYTMLVTVRNARAIFSAPVPSVACLGATVTLSAGASIDVFGVCSRGYVCYVDNLPPIDKTVPTFTTQFFSAGTHTVKVAVKDLNSCMSETFTTIRVSSVSPAFSFASPSVCVNGIVQLINTSTSSSPDPITACRWTFEQGQTLSTNGITSPTYTYTNATPPFSQVTSVLQVTNSIGCVGSALNTILVRSPNAAFVASQYNFCIGANPFPITFNALGANASYTYNYGTVPPTSSVTTGSTSTFSYSQAGTYFVTLKARDFSGCENSSGPMILAAQKTPTANFTFSSPKSNGGNVICSPAQVSFTATSGQGSSPISNYNWNLGSGVPVVSQPVVTYPYTNTNNANIVVSLTMQTSFGCSSSQTKNFTIYTPKADILANKTTVCLGDAITFNIKDTTGRGILAWNWDFGTNNTTSTVLANSSPPSSTVQPFTVFNGLTGGWVDVNLIYYSSQYACRDFAKLSIRVIKTLADFKRNAELLPSDSVHCLKRLDNFVNTSPMLAGYSSSWNFGNGVTSSALNPSYTYPQAGIYQVSLTVTGEQSCKGQAVKNMTINPLPRAKIVSRDSLCKRTLFDLTGIGISTVGITGYTWSPAANFVNPYTSTTSGSLSASGTLSLIVSDANGCVSDPTVRSIYIYDPKADIVASKTTVCLGEAITFNLKDTTGRGIFAWNWDFGNNNTASTVIASSSPPASTVQPFTVFNTPNGFVTVRLIYYSKQFSCQDSAKQNIRVIKTFVDFKRNAELQQSDSIHCVRVQDVFVNTSPSSAGYPVSWNFGNGATSAVQSPTYTFAQSGVYQVSLTVTGEQNCKGLSVKNMTINPLPRANIVTRDSICKDALFDLTGVGTSTVGITGYTWSPVAAFVNPYTSPASGSLTESGIFSLIVSDANGCVSDPTVRSIYIQQPTLSREWDTTVIVGEPIPINAYVGANFSYTWSPVADLSCIYCPFAISSSTVNLTYSVDVLDNLGCFRVTSAYKVNIDPQTSVDVPTAFTPNGDGTNDVIYVDGWGIKKLNYFKIFNRWGQLIFESNDIKIGWDGTYNGVPQNTETYIYQVSVRTYPNEKDLTKTSSFRLIR